LSVGSMSISIYKNSQTLMQFNKYTQTLKLAATNCDSEQIIINFLSVNKE